MASFFSVVRVLPSVIAEEFVNVGVVAFDDEVVAARLLCDWARAAAFAGVDPAVLELSAADLVAQLRRPGDVRRAAREWHGAIQLSQLRASTLEPRALLERVARLYLCEEDPEAAVAGADDRKARR